jgi:hypothetical protein
VSWERPFDQAVLLPNGGTARTLRDAANYIRKLPKLEHDCTEWRLAVHMLIEVAEDCGTMLFARVGMLRAMNTMPNRALNRNCGIPRIPAGDAASWRATLLAVRLHDQDVRGALASTICRNSNPREPDQ